MSKIKNLKIYSDYAYVGEMDGKLMLVKEKFNFKSLISNKEFDDYMGVTLFKDVLNPKAKGYKRVDFDIDTLKKLNDLDENEAKKILIEYYNQQINNRLVIDKKDQKNFNKVYSRKYRKEHNL